VAVVESSRDIMARSRRLAAYRQAQSQSAYYPKCLQLAPHSGADPARAQTNYLDIGSQKRKTYLVFLTGWFHFQWGENELLMWEHCQASND
jgi:hypothetical protein